MPKFGHILDRYVVRNMLFSYAIVFAVFVGLRIVVDMFTEIDEFTETLLPAGQVVRNMLSFYSYHIFQYYQDFAGPIVVFAALFTLFRIRRANETITMLSSGISLHRLLWPVAAVGIALNTLLIVNQELIIPRIADKLVREQEYTGRDKPVAVKLQADRNKALLLGQLYPSQGRMTNIILILRDNGGQMKTLQRADSAVWDEARGGWLLQQAHILDTSDENAERQVMQADVFHATDLSPRELSLRASSEFLKFQSTARIIEMSTQPYIRSQMGSTLDAERHFRFTTPIINVIILMLAAPLVVSREPKSIFLQMIKGLLVIMGAFALAFVCQQLAGQYMRPLLAAWLPVILFGPIAVLVLDAVKT